MHTSLDAQLNTARFLESLQLAISFLLADKRDGYSEFELIKCLTKPPYSLFAPDCLRNNHSLFQVHFFLFNALYRLRDHLHHEQQATLEISAVKIQMRSSVPGQAALSDVDELRAYYLDWSQFEKTGPEEVEALLDSFWRQLEMPREDSPEASLALKTLELSPPVDYPGIKTQYRRLVMKHHPDRGGDPERLKEINEAMFVLSKYYRA